MKISRVGLSPPTLEIFFMIFYLYIYICFQILLFLINEIVDLLTPNNFPISF